MIEENLADDYDVDMINKDRRILLVDDEPYNIMGLKIILIQTDYSTIS